VHNNYVGKKVERETLIVNHCMITIVSITLVEVTLGRQVLQGVKMLL
jgi:hypothetical protein